MGHNNVVSGQSKSTGIPPVDELSTGPQIWGVITWYQNFGKPLPRELGCGYPQVWSLY